VRPLRLYHAILATLLTSGAAAQETPLALTGVTVIDGTGAPPRPNMTVVVTGDRITQVFATGERSHLTHA
jgi:hypothetical protein